MTYIAYDGTQFDNLECCEKYNNKLKEKYSINNTDPIYLLSDEEYRYYKKIIPLIPAVWWLRSFGYNSDYAAVVSATGSIDADGFGIIHDCIGVRPVLNLEHLKPKIDITHYPLINNGFPYRFAWAGAIWRTLEADKIAIAEMPIFYSEFDGESNNYESSFIRNKLLQWYNSRVSNHFIVQEVMGL